MHMILNPGDEHAQAWIWGSGGVILEEMFNTM